MVELRILASNCNYGDKLQEMLRDRIVCGIRDTGVLRKLLAGVNLIYRVAVDTILAAKATAQQVLDIRGDQSKTVLI